MRRAAWIGIGSLACAAFVACSAFDETESTPPPVVVPDAGPADAAIVEASIDGDAPTTCSPDLSSDPRNCGRCAHDCLAGACKAGVCEPFVLASSAGEADQIALGDVRVYWEEGTGASHQIVTCPRGGCDGSGPALVVGGLADVRSIATRLAAMYFTTYDSNAASSVLESCTVAACAATRRTVEGPVTSALFPFTPLRASADGVWWGRQITTDGELHRVTGAGTTPEVLGSTGCIPARIARGVTDVLWTCYSSSTISQCGVPCTMAGGTQSADVGSKVDEIERGAGIILWDDEAGQKLVAITEAGSRTLPARGKGAIAVVGDALVFVDGLLGEIAECTLPGCGSRRTLAKNATTVTNLVADRDGVYWTNKAQGVVMGVAR